MDKSRFEWENDNFCDNGTTALELSATLFNERNKPTNLSDFWYLSHSSKFLWKMCPSQPELFQVVMNTPSVECQEGCQGQEQHSFCHRFASEPPNSVVSVRLVAVEYQQCCSQSFQEEHPKFKYKTMFFLPTGSRCENKNYQ